MRKWTEGLPLTCASGPGYECYWWPKIRSSLSNCYCIFYSGLMYSTVTGESREDESVIQILSLGVAGLSSLKLKYSTLRAGSEYWSGVWDWRFKGSHQGGTILLSDDQAAESGSPLPTPPSSIAAVKHHFFRPRPAEPHSVFPDTPRRYTTQGHLWIVSQTLPVVQLLQRLFTQAKPPYQRPEPLPAYVPNISGEVWGWPLASPQLPPPYYYQRKAAPHVSRPGRPLRTRGRTVPVPRSSDRLREDPEPPPGL